MKPKTNDKEMKMDNELDRSTTQPSITNNIQAVITEIQAVLQAVVEGTAKGVNINIDQNGDAKITARSTDNGKHYSFQQKCMKGVIEHNRTVSTKLTKEDRLILVEQMCNDPKKNYTQNDIAEKAMVSQRTISSDMDKLRNEGKIK